MNLPHCSRARASRLSFLLTLFTSLVALRAQAQTWQVVNVDYQAIASAGVSSMIVAGGRGLILRSDDAGYRWDVVKSGTTHRLVSACFVDAMLTVVVGNAGTILRTSDGGRSWEASVSQTVSNLGSVIFASDTVGFAIGSDVVLRTTDRGSTWSDVSIPEATGFRSGYFLDRDHGFIVGDSGRIFRTSDAGITWSSVPSNSIATLSDIVFVDQLNGVIVGSDHTIIRTSDGGATWVAATDPSIALNPQRVVRDSTGRLIAAGIGSPSTGLSLSTDAGATWAPAGDSLGIALPAFLDVLVHSSSHFVAVGNLGTIAHSVDSGRTWRRTARAAIDQGIGLTIPLTAVGFASKDTGVVGGRDNFSSYMLRTVDGGATWSGDRTIVPAPPSGIHFLDRDSGLIVFPVISRLRTGDAGATWNLTEMRFEPHATRIWAITSGDGGILYAIADQSVYVSQDRGYNWTAVGRPVPDAILVGPNLFVLSPTEIVVPGVVLGASSLYRSTDRGETWRVTLVDTPSTSPIAVGFIDARSGVAGDGYGRLFRTEDGGETWSPISSETSHPFTSIRFFNESVGYAIAGPDILRSSDAGRTWEIDDWTTVPADTLRDLRYIVLLPDGRTLLVTGDGLILRKELDEPLLAIGEPEASTKETAQLHLEAYPNPASGKQMIAMRNVAAGATAQATVQLFDATGALVQDLTSASTLARRGDTLVGSIDVKDAVSGVYLLVVEIGGQRATTRITVLR